MAVNVGDYVLSKDGEVIGHVEAVRDDQTVAVASQDGEEKFEVAAARLKYQDGMDVVDDAVVKSCWKLV